MLTEDYYYRFGPLFVIFNTAKNPISEPDLIFPPAACEWVFVIWRSWRDSRWSGWRWYSNTCDSTQHCVTRQTCSTKVWVTHLIWYSSVEADLIFKHCSCFVFQNFNSLFFHHLIINKAVIHFMSWFIMSFPSLTSHFYTHPLTRNSNDPHSSSVYGCQRLFGHRYRPITAIVILS